MDMLERYPAVVSDMIVTKCGMVVVSRSPHWHLRRRRTLDLDLALHGKCFTVERLQALLCDRFGLSVAFVTAHPHTPPAPTATFRLEHDEEWYQNLVKRWRDT